MIYQPIENTGEYTTGTVYSEKYVKGLEQEIERLHTIIKEAIEYLTGYESINTIQGLDNLEILNEGLDYKTIEEITNRYLKVHDKLLEILDKESK